MKNPNYQRLTVYLNNHAHDKNFVTTYTYKNIPDQKEAMNCLLNMHTNPSDTKIDVAKKIKKAFYNGKEIKIIINKKSIWEA